MGLLKEKVNVNKTSKNIVSMVNKEVKKKIKISQKNIYAKTKVINKKEENIHGKINLFQFAINFAKNYDNTNFSL